MTTAQPFSLPASLFVSLMHTHTHSLSLHPPTPVCLLHTYTHTHLQRVQYYSGICLCFRISSTDSKTKNKKNREGSVRDSPHLFWMVSPCWLVIVCLHPASFDKSAFHYRCTNCGCRTLASAAAWRGVYHVIDFPVASPVFFSKT